VAIGDTRFKIFVGGVLSPKTLEKFKAFVSARNNPPAIVYFDSPGGDLASGMNLGTLIRRLGYASDVGAIDKKTLQVRKGSCASACVFAYAGGTFRYLTAGSTIGVHRFSSADGKVSDSDLDVGQVVTAASSAYFSEMGVSPEVIEKVALADKDSLYVLTNAELLRYRVVNGGALAASWKIQAADGVLYLKGEQAKDSGHFKLQFLCLEESKSVAIMAWYEGGANGSKFSSDNAFHWLFVDMKQYALAKPIKTSSDGRYSVTLHALSKELVEKIQKAHSIGRGATSSKDAPTFYGFNIDIGIEDRSLVSGFFSYCGPTRVSGG
jgi:ATP-dependent protease ClpP protease subunit